MGFRSTARLKSALSSFLLVVIPSCFIVMCSCSKTTAQMGITSVWAVDESEKIKRHDLDHPLKTDSRNGVWDGKQISVFGARNEIVGFQVILGAEGKGAAGVSVYLDSLSSGAGVIRNLRTPTGPFDYSGRRIELFTESYIDVKKRGEWWPASARPLPDDLHRGEIPDALVPVDVKGTFAHGSGGAPFDIAAGSNQGIWVDIFVPSGQPPGEYRGDFRVVESGRTTYSIPVVLKVFGFTLPDTTHLHNHFFWGWVISAARHGVPDKSPEYWQLFHNYAKVFHRHRLDLIDGRRTLPEFVSRLAGYYTGAFYTAQLGYDGPGGGVGNQTYSIGTYDQPDDGWRSGFFPDSAGAWQRAADAWEGWFRTNAPAVVRYKYLEDEPPYAHWPEVKRKALWIRNAPGIGRNLGTHVTARMGRELFGAVSFWMTTGPAGWADSGGTGGFDIGVARERKGAGDRVGFYNGQRPSYGEPVAIDNFATDARVNPWIAWKYDADQYFLWETAYYADTRLNAWAEGVAGSIIYTGEDRKFPEDSRGLRGPVVSIRLKNLRRGFQDYEYLWLARHAGLDTRAIVDRVVPAAFNDYNGTSFTSQNDQPTWAERGYMYEDARRTLAEFLQEAERRGVLPAASTTEMKAKE